MELLQVALEEGWVVMVKELKGLYSLFMALCTWSKPSSINSSTVCGIGGVLMSTEPSSILTTSPIVGLMETSSWMHQNATLRALVSSSSSTALFNLLSATFIVDPFVIS